MIKYQHYVSRFYLEGFSFEGKIWCYDKHLDKVYRCSPDAVGGEKYFYDFPQAEQDLGVSQFVEKWFNPIESASANVLKRWRLDISQSRRFVPTDTEMATMAVFLTIQLLRTPSWRTEAAECHEMAHKIDFYNYLGRKDPELARRIKNPLKEMSITLSEEGIKAAHLSTLLDEDLRMTLVEDLIKHFWIVTIHDHPGALYVSDEPVVKHAHVKHPFRSMSGLRSPGIQIIFPLLSNASLSLMERTHW